MICLSRLVKNFCNFSILYFLTFCLATVTKVRLAASVCRYWKNYALLLPVAIVFRPSNS